MTFTFCKASNIGTIFIFSVSSFISFFCVNHKGLYRGFEIAEKFQKGIGCRIFS